MLVAEGVVRVMLCVHVRILGRQADPLHPPYSLPRCCGGPSVWVARARAREGCAVGKRAE